MLRQVTAALRYRVAARVGYGVAHNDAQRTYAQHLYLAHHWLFVRQSGKAEAFAIQHGLSAAALQHIIISGAGRERRKLKLHPTTGRAIGVNDIRLLFHALVFAIAEPQLRAHRPLLHLTLSCYCGRRATDVCGLQRVQLWFKVIGLIAAARSQ